MSLQQMESRTCTMRFGVVNFSTHMQPYGQQSAESRSGRVTSVPAEALYPGGSTNRSMGKPISLPIPPHSSPFPQATTAEPRRFGFKFWPSDRQSEQRVCERGSGGFLLVQGPSMVSPVLRCIQSIILNDIYFILFFCDLMTLILCVKQAALVKITRGRILK